VGMSRRLWLIVLSKRQIVELLQTIELASGLLLTVPLPMVTTTVLARTWRLTIRLTFGILVGIITILRLLLLVVPSLAFALLLPLHVTYFHGYNLVIHVRPITLVTLATTLGTRLWTITTVCILPVVYG
jgi:hypothetical protein